MMDTLRSPATPDNVFVRVVAVELENLRPALIDPDDRMSMADHRVSPRRICKTAAPTKIGCLAVESKLKLSGFGYHERRRTRWQITLADNGFRSTLPCRFSPLNGAETAKVLEWARRCKNNIFPSLSA